MGGAFSSLTRALRRLFAGGAEPSSEPLPPVYVHDPAALAPHDLDDPFFSSDVQSRIGEVIASKRPPDKDNP